MVSDFSGLPAITVKLMFSTLNFSHFDLSIIEKYKYLILGITLNVFGIKCLTLEMVGQ